MMLVAAETAENQEPRISPNVSTVQASPAKNTRSATGRASTGRQCANPVRAAE